MGRYAYCSVATNGDIAYGHKTTNGKSPTVMGQPTAGRLHFTSGGFQRHIHLFLGRLRLSFFRGSAWSGVWLQSVNGGAGFRPAPLVAVAVDFLAVLRGGLPFARFGSSFAFFRSFPSAVSVSPSALLSCVFAPFPCVFWAVECLSCGYPLRRFRFNALFRPFTAFFRSARVFIQGNKKTGFCPVKLYFLIASDFVIIPPLFLILYFLLILSINKIKPIPKTLPIKTPNPTASISIL